MSSGFHRLGANVKGKVTGYHANSLPVGVIVAGQPIIQVPTPKSTSPQIAATLINGELPAAAPAQRTLDKAQARLSGYTGDACSSCQSMQVKRNGSCLVCEACGTTTGCS